MERGSIWWAELPEPVGSMPGYRRPVVVVQSETFNRSRINTVVVVPLTTNLRLASASGNVILKARACNLPKDSVANVSQVSAVDKGFLTEYVGNVPPRTMSEIEEGLRLVLGL